MVEGLDGGIGLGGQEGLGAAGGVRGVGAVVRQDTAQAVDFAEPDGICHVRADGGDEVVDSGVEHGFAGNAGVKAGFMGVFEAGEAVFVGGGARFPVGQNCVIFGTN